MEASFASFQQPQAHNPHHQAYPATQNGNASITSPNQQQIHQPPSQTSPMMAQANPYAQHQAGAGHQQLPYNTGGYASMQAYPGLSASQAASMAAAAASGSHYYNMPTQGLVHDGKNDGRARGSPPSGGMAQALPQRRMSHMDSPVVQQPGALNPRGPGMGQAAIPQATQDASTVEDAPLYVNAKQFHRILKRRIARQKLEEALRLTSKGRKPYLHESRHNHAMRRPRGPGGRFLTSDEVAAMEKQAKEGGGDSSNGEMTPTVSTGSKRKAGSSSGSSAKKSRNAVKPPGADVEEEEEDAEDDEDDS